MVLLNTLKIAFIVIVCPDGFEDKEGDIAGPGLENSYSVTFEGCANDCDKRKDCNSFAYSKKEGKCKLMNGPYPTHVKYQDYQFCRKGKAINSIGLIHLIFSFNI